MVILLAVIRRRYLPSCRSVDSAGVNVAWGFRGSRRLQVTSLACRSRNLRQRGVRRPLSGARTVARQEAACPPADQPCISSCCTELKLRAAARILHYRFCGRTHGAGRLVSGERQDCHWSGWGLTVYRDAALPFVEGVKLVEVCALATAS